MKFLKNISILSILFLSSSLNAAVITLDFTSGVFSNEKNAVDTEGNVNPAVFDTYTQDGFTLTTLDIGNHIDPGGLATIGFHNGPANPVTDNNLILTFSGGGFDLTDIIGFILSAGANSLDLTDSSGASLLLNTDGDHSLSLLNVTSVVFSVSGTAANWDSFIVNTTPSSVPVPAAVWLFSSGLIGLVGVAKRKKA